MANRPQIVILGGGFGGLLAARKLKRVRADITVIDRTNHHTFQPLLYQVATAALAPTDIAAPIRHILRNQENTTVLMSEATVVDPARRVVTLTDEQEISYDYLIVATGTRHSYFGHPEWEKFAPGLKGIEDATEMRRRFLLAFEEAEKAKTTAERDAWMTFVVVGGGPTGCELAGVMQEIARKAMHDDFRTIDTRDTAVILLEAGDRLLPAFPEDLALHATNDLKKLQVDVRAHSAVTNIDANSVYIGDHAIPTHTVFWAAGNVASPVAKSLGVPLTKSGQVIVEPDLSIPGHPEIFVIGDLAYAIQRNGKPAPGVAQVAMQEGRVAAYNIISSLGGRARKPFHYLNKGDLATIGRSKAIANLFGGRIKLTGRLAWWLWLLIHITYLIGFRNRLSVLLQWAYAYLTYQRGARLITLPSTRASPSSSVS
jgi:NADH dehydrogenase